MLERACWRPSFQRSATERGLDGTDCKLWRIVKPAQFNILVDSHAHYYECFDPAKFLAGAFRNFCKAGQSLGLSEWHGCLIVSATPKSPSFRRLQQILASEGWDVRRTQERVSFSVKGPRNEELFLIGGLQTNTSEGIEVIVAGDAGGIASGMTLRTMLTCIDPESTFAVIPWGFGKWCFRRGKILHHQLAERPRPIFFLGDNSGRPRIVPDPRQFRTAMSNQVWILPGSDPLEFPGHASKAGCSGIFLSGAFDLGRPFDSIRMVLSQCAAQPKTFRQRETLPNFCFYQTRVHARRLRRFILP